MLIVFIVNRSNCKVFKYIFFKKVNFDISKIIASIVSTLRRYFNIASVVEMTCRSVEIISSLQTILTDIPGYNNTINVSTRKHGKLYNTYNACK
jgi:hypothetical protein